MGEAGFDHDRIRVGPPFIGGGSSATKLEGRTTVVSTPGANSRVVAEEQVASERESRCEFQFESTALSSWGDDLVASIIGGFLKTQRHP